MVEVIRGAGVAVVVKVLAAVLRFGVSVLLARLLGVEGAGIYFLALTFVTIGMTVGRFGLDNTILRFVAAHSVRGEWGAVKEVYRKGIILSALVSLLSTLILMLIGPWLATSALHKPELAVPLQWMSLSVFPMAMIFLHSEALKALKQIRDSQLVNGVFLPLFTVCGLFFLARPYGVTGAVWSYSLAAVFSALAGRWIWRLKTRHVPVLDGSFSTSDLLQSAVPLLWVSLMAVVTNWSSTLFLGAWGSKIDVGVFGAALRTSMLTSFILTSVNSVVAPKFSALYAKGDMAGIERVARQSAKMMTFFASPLLILFLTAPEWVMGIFGDGFKGGGLILTILAVGQFINVATGSVGYLLMMTGHECLMRNNTIIVGSVSIVLGLIAIPLWGGVGAALTTSFSLAITNLAAFYLVWRKLKIWTLPIGGPGTGMCYEK